MGSLKGNRASLGSAWRVILIVAFAAMSLRYVLPPLLVGLPYGWDAVGYTKAARALISGGNPWSLSDVPVAFAGPPPSLLPFLPFAWMPDWAVGLSWTLICLASALYIVRRLELPWWWLLFPPLVHGITAGSGSVPALALMLAGHPLLDAVAAAARIYVGLPLLLLGRWRSLVATAVLIAVTAPFLAWPTFMELRAPVQAALEAQSTNLTAFAVPFLIPVAVLGLILLGRERAAWLSVAALWPWTQHFYASIAMPALAASPFVALSLAFEVPGLVAVGLAAQVISERGRSWLAALPPQRRGIRGAPTRG